MSDEQDWLKAEKVGDEMVAEATFARAVAGLPAIQPSADFAARTAQFAWRARRRRRVAVRLAGVAATILIGMATLGVLYESGVLVAGLATRGIVLFSHGLAWGVSWVGRETTWWLIGGRLGATVSDAIGIRNTAAALAAAGAIVVGSIYAFHQWILDGTDARESRKS